VGNNNSYDKVREEFLKTFSRREFINVCSKENLKCLFGAINGFHEGVKEKSRRSCDEVSLKFFKKRTASLSIIRKEGQSL
jgi:hypothetical protein